MSDASSAAEGWAGYLRRMTERPGWSVARLARDANIHRGTIFKWMSGSEGVTVASVRAVAAALGDDVENALRAAAGISPSVSSDPRSDPVIQWILENPKFTESEKTSLVKREIARIERDRAERIIELEWLLSERDSRGTA